jgi:Spy/CpxP family protein refolding chaperone
MAFSLLIGATSPLAAQQHQHQSPQPYAGQQSRRIKALSEAEISGYLKGEGMGYAKVAELNRYPGPRHVLDLADQLDLTPEQRSKTQSLFESMRTRAVELGARFVDQEAELDRLFAEARIDDAGLQLALHEIALTQAELRAIHLRAHLAMRTLLTEQQIAEYDRLRGYAGGKGHGDQGHGAHH